MRDTALRYLLIGITCAFLYNVILIAGDFVGLHYTVSTVVSFAVVVLWGYVLHSIFTFGRDLSVPALLRYALGMAANLPISLALMFLFCDVGHIAVAVAAPTTTAILLLWNLAASYWAIVVNPAQRKVV